jgi:hypothetical protein
VSALHLPQSLHALQRRADNKQFAEIEADLMPTLTAMRLDEKRTSYVGRKGDLTVLLTEVDMPARKREPAMLLVHRADPTNKHVYVLLREMWVLLDPVDLAATQAQAAAVNAMAERLFGFVTKDDCYRVLDVIYDFADDLKNAKPPVWMTHGQWLQALAEDDMTFIQNGVVVNG